MHAQLTERPRAKAYYLSPSSADVSQGDVGAEGQTEVPSEAQPIGQAAKGLDIKDPNEQTKVSRLERIFLTPDVETLITAGSPRRSLHGFFELCQWPHMCQFLTGCRVISRIHYRQLGCMVKPNARKATN